MRYSHDNIVYVTRLRGEITHATTNKNEVNLHRECIKHIDSSLRDPSDFTVTPEIVKPSDVIRKFKKPIDPITRMVVKLHGIKSAPDKDVIVYLTTSDGNPRFAFLDEKDAKTQNELDGFYNPSDYPHLGMAKQIINQMSILNEFRATLNPVEELVLSEFYRML